MRFSAETSGHMLFNLQVANRAHSRTACPQLLLEHRCFREKSHCGVVDFFEEGAAQGVG